MIYEKKPLPKISQGDIFLPEKDKLRDIFGISKDVPLVGLIILSNTCDIKHLHVERVCVSPIFPLKYLLDSLFKKRKSEGKKAGKKWKRGFIDNLAKYNSKIYFYLEKNSKDKISNDSVAFIEIILNFRLADVSNIISETKLCSLKSPWREKLGWSVGNLYNRVSLKDYPSGHAKRLISSHLPP